MAVHIVSHILPMVEEALEPRPNTDDIGYDVSIQGTEQGPVCAILFTRPGAVLGTTIMAIASLHMPVKATQKDVNTAVHNLIESLDEQRSKQLSSQQPQPGTD